MTSLTYECAAGSNSATGTFVWLLPRLSATVAVFDGVPDWPTSRPTDGSLLVNVTVSGPAAPLSSWNWDRAVLSQFPCSRLQAAFLPETGGIEIRGHVPVAEL